MASVGLSSHTVPSLGKAVYKKESQWENEGRSEDQMAAENDQIAAVEGDGGAGGGVDPDEARSGAHLGV